MLSENQQALDDKLKSLIDLIVEEAGNNPAFLKKIETSLSKITSIQKSKSGQNKAKGRINFSHMSILQEHGEEKLIQELKALDYETLSKMSVNYKIYRTSKESKKFDKAGLIEVILKQAKQKLNVGSVFLRN